MGIHGEWASIVALDRQVSSQVGVSAGSSQVVNEHSLVSEVVQRGMGAGSSLAGGMVHGTSTGGVGLHSGSGVPQGYSRGAIAGLGLGAPMNMITGLSQAFPAQGATMTQGAFTVNVGAGPSHADDSHQIARSSFPRPDTSTFERVKKRQREEEADDEVDSETGLSTSDFRKLLQLVTSFFPGVMTKEDRPPPPTGEGEFL